MLLTSKKSVGTVNIPVLLGIVGIHVLGLFGIVSTVARILEWSGRLCEFSCPSFVVWCARFFTWSGFGWFFVLYIVTGLGVTLCYHRLLTHSSFVTSTWFRCVLTTCGNLSFQGRPIRWVAVHRDHHNHSDEEDDPHSPLHGAWWAHNWWFLFNDLPGVDVFSLARDLQKDPWLVLMDKFYWVPQVALTLLLFGFGFWIGGIYMALSWIFLGIGLRTVCVYHITWSTNSICHMHGDQPHDTGDQSRNNAWLAIPSFGESWHNNHHYDPSAAAHGKRNWKQIDLTYEAIRLLVLLGLASKIRKTKEERDRNKSLKNPNPAS